MAPIRLENSAKEGDRAVDFLGRLIKAGSIWRGWAGHLSVNTQPQGRLAALLVIYTTQSHNHSAPQTHPTLAPKAR